MKLQGIQDILRGAAMPQLQQSPSPQLPEYEDVYPDNYFDGEEECSFDEQTEDSDFQANLAEDMSDSYLDKLSTQFKGEIDDDETDRQPWMDMVSKVQEQIGIGEDSSYEEPFPGCSTVVYPLFVKAQIQFTARAMPEIFPNDPVKGVILGDTNEMLEEQSERVADVMNYQYQYQDPDNKKDFARMLTWLPYVGSAFRYASHDPITNKNIVRYIPAGDLIVAYATTSLTNAYRITHRFRDSKNDIIKLQQAGFYRDVDLFADNTASGDDDEEENSVRTLRDTADGSTPNSDSSTSGQNQTCFNIYTYCDLEGYEDTDESGEMTGIALPYVFTMHEATGKILAIRRNWKQDDEYKTQRIYFAHYKYHEGLGFYGAGLPHLIGSIQTAITGALRSFGDSMAFSIMQGGFKLKNCKIAGSQKMAPGQFLDADAEGVDDVNKAIKFMNFPAPTPQVLQYIELLTKVAEDIISIGDLMTGDQSSQNAPVGSTLAIIEQATKVISAQHKSLIESLSEEFRIMYDLNYDYLPDEDQFVVPSKAGIIRRSDFDGKVAVIPTADPSVSSFQQRQAIDQATMQLSQVPGFSQYFKEAGYPLLRRMLKNLNVPDLDGILMSEEEVQQQQAQAAQNPPQPNPDQIKAQVMQQDSQTKAQAAAANAQQMQADSQLEQAKLEIEKLKLALQEKQIDMKYATDDKMIDARFLGTVAPALQQSSDSLAMQNIQHQQDQAMQQQDQQHQMTMQRMAAAQAAQQQAATPVPAPAEGQAAQEAPDPQVMHDQMMAAQHGAAQPAPQVPDKQGMLMQLMSKIRGR